MSLDPASLFNLSTLHIHVPPSPLGPGPASTSLRRGSSARPAAQAYAEVDEWITQLCQSPEREDAFYDESLPFYLLFRLPHVGLTRAQATAFLLPSLTQTAHLHLSADLSFVEGDRATLAAQQPPPPPPHGAQPHPFPQLSTAPRRRSSLGPGLSSLNGSPSLGAAKRAHLSLNTSSSDGDLAAIAKGPMTPAPLPQTRKGDTAFGEAVGVPLKSYTFGTEEGRRDGGVKGVEGGGKVWVGKEGGETGEGGWVGVWQFGGDIAFVRSPLVEPRLCLTITTTFHDDPRLVDLIERQTSDSLTVDGLNLNEHEPGSDDEYLVESFDDVNLLEGLDPSLNLHLPASRLPSPPSAPPSAPPRRASVSSRRSLSISAAAGSSTPLNLDKPLHPIIRRSFRRVLTLRSALHVRMRTVACPVSGLGVGTRLMPGMGMDNAEEEEGLVMCVEVMGVGDSEGRGGFELEQVRVQVTGGVAGAGDVEVKEVQAERSHDALPLRLGPTDQHNFLYAVTFSATNHDLTPQDEQPAKILAPGGSVPIHVATSPSQRFAAKFGDEPDRQHEKVEHDLPKLPPSEQANLRNVAIIVRGRPVGSTSRPGTMDLGISLTPQRVEEEAWPTESFESRWNCSLDISPFTAKAPTQSTAFIPSLPPQPATVSFGKRPGIGASARPAGTPSLRPQLPAEDTVEAVAGSHRHTIASLSSLANKSPHLGRRGSKTSALDTASLRQGTFRIDELQTPGATGPSRKFFTLPNGSNATFVLPVPGLNPSISGGELVGTPTGYGPHTGGFDFSRATTPQPGAITGASTPAYPPKSQTMGASVSRQTAKEVRGGAVGGAWDAPAWDAAGERLPDTVLVSVSLIPLRALRKDRTASPVQLVEDPSDLSAGLDATLSPPSQPLARFGSSVGQSSPTLQPFAFPTPEGARKASLPKPSVTIPPRRPSFPVRGESLPPSPRLPASPVLPGTPVLGKAELEPPEWTTPRVGLLDVFLVEVFVMNSWSGGECEGFSIGVPPSSRRREGKSSGEEEASIVALENDVKIGRLAPGACASARMRFLAVRPGCHELGELRLVHLGSGLETRLVKPLEVVVE